MADRPSVILIREWEGQMSSSGCCGRLSGDFLNQSGEPVFAERRATMEAMGPLYCAIRERFGEQIEVNVIDPRSLASLISLVVRDTWRYRPGFRETWRTFTRLGVQGVILNGRLVSHGDRWPAPDALNGLLEQQVSRIAIAPAEPSTTH